VRRRPWHRALLPHEWAFAALHLVILIGLLGVRPRDWPLIGCFALYLALTGSIRVDTFPSMHCALPAFILGFDFLYHRRRFWVGLFPCLLLWFSTIYLRYHYLVDAVAGFALAALAFFLATRWRVRGRVTA
jgi:membrane-associated phospholipid phosphatase